MGCIIGKGSALGFDGIVDLTLKEKTQVTKDSICLSFSIPGLKKLGLRAGEHVYLIVTTPGGEPVLRPFTPVKEENGTVDFVIKVYKPCERHPQGGEMSQLLDKLKIGNTVECRGPYGRISYLGNSLFRISQQADGGGKVDKTQVRYLNFVCGGTGVTPVISILTAIAQESAEVTPAVKVIVANHTVNDILCHETLDLVSNHPKITVIHAISHAHVGKDANPLNHVPVTGRITAKMLGEHLNPPQHNTLSLVCGPSRFMASAYEFLFQLGHHSNTVLEF
eukprot:Hpha_TRINITY_DN14666_c1_g1::TRINITY_DN14666_c1_g1_i1::g.48464::m.48464/K00326/E1.6.2.2; cytochrome-b5 reductase